MNAINLRERAAIVTGGARGIGYACAERMIASGARVMLWDVDAEALLAAKETLGANAFTALVDVTNEAAIGAATQSCIEVFSKIDILVNNAGITGPNVKTWEYPPADFRKVVELDLVAPFLVARTFAPHMIAAGLRSHCEHRECGR